MILTDETLSLIMDLGLPKDKVIALLRAIDRDMEAFTPRIDPVTQRRRESDRERKRSDRRKSADVGGQAGQSADPPLETKGVPAPLPKTQNPTTPPIVPPTSQSAALVDELWRLQPAKHRRSNRPDIAKALKAALRRGGEPDDIRQAFGVYYRLPDCRKDEGAFAMGAHRLLAEDRWRDHLPTVEPPRPPPSPDVQAHRLAHLRATGEWRSDWGEIPEEQAA